MSFVDTWGGSSATLKKRKKTGRLSLVEGDRLWSIAVVLNGAFALLGNDLDSARKWMGMPSLALNWKTPLEMLGTRVEMNAVLDLIGRLEEGVVV
ncbi:MULTISPECIES: antitoxin Xre/MbcA/ParS toxin-binding domain-containing protein [unclassified Pseudomonas]|uniref:antitoxin Xre/MbcA/ParS toxin-binding domain-containing protein n=1 Tax=unclassified Pseudomonas TaxID=196821 RepID=UPI001B32B490|nr:MULTISPECIES: antitoxin Xre/MbcA/ParS toxin-binding domain-containing protein [unclassified Pseudomonas]